MRTIFSIVFITFALAVVRLCCYRSSVCFRTYPFFSVAPTYRCFQCPCLSKVLNSCFQLSLTSFFPLLSCCFLETSIEAASKELLGKDKGLRSKAQASGLKAIGLV